MAASEDDEDAKLVVESQVNSHGIAPWLRRLFVRR